MLDRRGDVISSAEVRVQRDLGELTVLANLAQRYVSNDEPVIVVTDSPLRLRVAELSFPRQQEGQKQYRALLDTLRNARIITAGYIDRPRSYYTLSMLYLASLDKITDDVLDQTPYRYITDIDLFKSILGPGERSAVFSFVEPQADEVEGCFFYLNTSKVKNHPTLARVEIPTWVAADRNLLNILHATLVRQAGISGNGYPYVLARAHEEAVISQAERQWVEDILAVAMLRQGMKLEPSPKQAQKNLLVS